MNDLVEFVEEFAIELKGQLTEDKKKWGETWRKLPVKDQEERVFNYMNYYWLQFKEVGTPVPWLKVAGLAMIAWMRVNHPEELVEND